MSFGLGLCRTCEIFGVSEFVIANARLVDDIQFKGLSVCAENWLRISEVLPSVQRFSKSFSGANAYFS